MSALDAALKRLELDCEHMVGMEDHKADVRLLLDEVDRLRAELAESCKVRDGEMQLREKAEDELAAARDSSALLARKLIERTKERNAERERVKEVLGWPNVDYAADSQAGGWNACLAAVKTALRRAAPESTPSEESWFRGEVDEQLITKIAAEPDLPLGHEFAGHDQSVRAEACCVTGGAEMCHHSNWQPGSLGGPWWCGKPETAHRREP